MISGIRSVWKSWTGSGSSKSKSDETQSETDVADSNPVNYSYVPEEPEVQRLSDAVKNQSRLLDRGSGPLPVYAIPLKDENINVDECKRFSFGKESLKRNRTIMVLGATGAGKSTLINGMINYILGVEWEDSYRFKLVDEGQSTSQAESQTSEVTVYKLNHQEGFMVDFSLTIVDTPGFGDTRGIVRDKRIVEQLRNLFSAPLGVSEIDAVCFVAQAALARLTPTQKYVFDSVLSIFGKDVAENIRILVTFADGQRPPVLEAIKASGVPCPTTKDGLPVNFKFNSSALFAHNQSSAARSSSGEDEEGGFDQMFWNMGVKSMKRFFVALNVIETKSLSMTKDVLKERQQLEVSVEGLQKQVKLGLAKLEEIKETAQQLKEHEAEISRNKDFVIEFKVTKPHEIDISCSGLYLTNCQQCHFTCHDNCAYANDEDKIHCCAMGPNGYCTVCPSNCVWSVHYNQKYKWEYIEVVERKTVKELEAKYLEARDAKTPVQALIDRLRAEYDLVQAAVVKLMDQSATCLNRLKVIALKPNPLSTPEYIDMLIEGEKSEAKSGWKQRVQYLIGMREKAEYLAKVDRGESLLQSPPSDFDSANQDQNGTNAEPRENQNGTNAEPGENQNGTNAEPRENQNGTNAEPGENQNGTNAEPRENQNGTNAEPGENQNGTNGDEEENQKLDTNPDVEVVTDYVINEVEEIDFNIDHDETNSDADQNQDSCDAAAQDD